MESFYGGKQGISFNIVQHFDGIDIPENTVFTGNYYAVDAYDLSLYGTQYNAGTGTFALSTQRLK